MGMYDTIRFEYPLPGENPFGYDSFQTKDMECQLGEYTVTSDGCLVLNGEIVKYSGSLECYTSNWRAVMSGFVFTSGGEDHISITYSVTFTDGRLVDIRQTEFTRELALDAEATRERRHLSVQAVEAARYEHVQSGGTMIGEILWLKWGSLDPSYGGEAVRVVAENDKELIVQKADTKFETMYRSQYGRTLFGTEEEALKYDTRRTAQQESERLFYTRLMNDKVEALNAAKEPE